MLDEICDHVFVSGVVGDKLYRELHHVLAEQGHPGRAVRLLQVAAGGQRGAPVENADVVEAEKSPLEHVFAEPVLPVHPPGKVQQELVKCRFQELDVCLAAQALHRCDGGTGSQRRGPEGSHR